MFLEFINRTLHILLLERMIGRMDYERLKRYSLTEIALLALFVLGLAIALMIVKVRHHVILSEPIPLAGAGLSVSVPTNPGWEYETKWRYESDGGIALVGQRRMGQAREVSIQWRYYSVDPGNSSAQEILQHRARQFDSAISDIKTTSGFAPMEYGIISPTNASDSPFYLGVAHLDFGRHLELHVYPHRMDLYDAEHIFRTLADSIQYELPRVIRNGKNLTEKFWDTAAPSSLFHDKQDAAFLINNIHSQPVGYGYYQYATHTADGKTQLQVSVRQYEQNVSQLDSTFWLNGDEKVFTWKTAYQHREAGEPRTYNIAALLDGTIIIRTNFEDDKQFNSDGLLLPELFLPEYTQLLLNAEQHNVIVDVLSPDGRVVPTAIEIIDIDSATARSEQIAFAVKVEFLNHPNSFEELYFDASKQFIGRFEQQDSKRRLWDVTTSEQLEHLFGEQFKSANETVAQIETPRRKPCEYAYASAMFSSHGLHHSVFMNNVHSK